MSFQILSQDEIEQHYRDKFAKLVPGQFFTIQYGMMRPTQYRLFYVKERNPDNISVVVHELSNPENRTAITTGQPLAEAVYHYNPENVLNLLNTTFGPGV